MNDLRSAYDGTCETCQKRHEVLLIGLMATSWSCTDVVTFSQKPAYHSYWLLTLAPGCTSTRLVLPERDAPSTVINYIKSHSSAKRFTMWRHAATSNSKMCKLAYYRRVHYTGLDVWKKHCLEAGWAHSRIRRRTGIDVTSPAPNWCRKKT